MKRLNLTAKIENGKMNYYDHWEENIAKFIKANEGFRIDITMEKVSGVRYYIHKIYRGVLLLDIVASMGEVDKEAIHVKLKWEFMGVRCESFEELPPTIQAKQIVVIGGKLQGYVPSMSKISQEKAKAFIQFCEHRLFVDLQGCIGESVRAEQLGQHNSNYKTYRQEIFKK